MLLDYIQFYKTQRTAAAKNIRKQNLLKIMNVAPCEITIKNVAKRTSIKVLKNIEKARRLAKKPQCIYIILFTLNLVTVKSQKLNYVINKPFQLKFAMLEYRNLYMYKSYVMLKGWTALTCKCSTQTPTF